MKNDNNQNFLAIKNKGLICMEDLYLIGSSTKRDDDTKIGMFGSGWKYALAWLLRNKCGIQIFSGNDQIKVGVKPIKHRDREVEIITINDRETSLTTEMGPDWTAWMAFREIVANAIDEGGFEYELNPSILKAENTTVVYISANEEFIDMFYNFDNYFSFNRSGGIVLDVNTRDQITLYIKKEKSPIVVYRKGIRCYNNEEKIESLFDIDIQNININESRIAEWYNIATSIKYAFQRVSSYDAFKAMLFNITELSTNTIYLTDELLANFEKAIEEGLEFTSDAASSLESKIGKIMIPDRLYMELGAAGLIKTLFSMLNFDDAPAGFVDDPNNSFDINDIDAYFKKLNINIKKYYFGKFTLDKYKSYKLTQDGVFMNTLCADYIKIEPAKDVVAKLLNNATYKFFEQCLDQ